MDKDTAVPMFLIACVVLIFIIRASSKQSNMQSFYEFCGGKDKLKYEFISGNYGIAIDVNKRTIFLKRGKTQKAYPYSDIRSWETLSETRVTGVNTQLSNQNIRSVSYFQVNVKDVDNAEWALMSVPAGRWTEILNQEIRES